MGESWKETGERTGKGVWYDYPKKKD